jgi:hypothetical protein
VQGERGVAEGVAETVTMDEAKKVLSHYGADNFKTTSNELHFYKNGKPMSVDLIWGNEGERSVSLSQLNSATRRLKGQGVAEGYTVTRGIDKERYQERAGLEGPFSTKSGKVVYYDKVEGKYYDPDTDMYIEYDDWQAMNEGIVDAIKTGTKKAFKALTGPDDEELIQRLEKETGGKRPEKKDSLPAVKENEYWCKLDRTAKLIPEGYKKLSSGYITRK